MTKGKFTIQLNTGPLEVEGWIMGSFGIQRDEWAITNPRYRITHLRSGRRVATCKSRQRAAALAKALDLQFSWDYELSKMPQKAERIQLIGLLVQGKR